MSEIKRAQLIPFGSQKDKEKPPTEPCKTVRISVVLPESTEDTCPEYNYKDELAAAKKRSKRKEPPGAIIPNGINGVDELEDDDDVRRIARQMEEKYGTGVTNKKKKKGRKDDYADIGMGYDESDSFIDNTDGYDEMIPQNVTTLHGGFYINSGALEFKTDDEANSDFSSSSSEDESPAKKTKKRVIESSDETDREDKTESGEKHAHKKSKMQNGGNGIQQSLKKKLLGQNNQILIKKRRPLDPLKKTVKELLKEKRVDLNMSLPQELNSSEISTIEDEKDKVVVSSNVSDVIESVVKAAVDDIKVEEKTSIPTITVEDTSQEKPVTEVVKQEVKLPENLPPDILGAIAAIRTAAEKNPDTSEFNSLILRLERKCKCLGKPSKIKVYEHISDYLKCEPEDLIVRAKKLVLDEEKTRLKELLTGLKTEIHKIMPALLESHEKESQRVRQMNSCLVNEENKNPRVPKRRFQWNDVAKKCLKDLLMLKKRCLLLEGKSKEMLDEEMLTFLKSEIQVLWPPGWMSMNALSKIYTTFGDPKRMATTPPNKSSTSAIKTLPQSFNNSNLSITPILAPPPPKSESKILGVSDLSVSKTAKDTSTILIKSLPESTTQCDIKPTSKKEVPEAKIKVKPQSELLKSSSQNYCEVIDLSDKTDSKSKSNLPVIPERSKPHDLSIIPTYPKVDHSRDHSKPKSSCDDIQKVMENLKVLENLSSPKKCTETSQSSAAVSVIAVNKSFSPKPSPSTMQRFDYKSPNEYSSKSTSDYNSKPTSEYSKPSDYTTSFQDEFQKQLFSAFNHISSTPTKSYNSIDRYPHISTSGASSIGGDKYFQSSNNNYSQSSNGHKSSSSAPQPAAAPKSQQK